HHEVADAEAAHGGALDEVAAGEDESAQPPVAPYHVVEAREDVGGDVEFHGQAAEQATDPPLGVDAHVGGEAVTNEGGRVVDQGQEPEEVAAAQVEAVRLEEVETIGRVDDDAAARPQTAVRFDDRLAIVVDVLDHLVQQDHVEELIRKR